MEPVPVQKRILLALALAVPMAGFVFLSWFALGFGIAGSLRGTKSETVGFSTIIVAPAGAALAFVVAFGLGLIPYGKRPWLRWVIAVLVSLLAGAALFGSMAM